MELSAAEIAHTTPAWTAWRLKMWKTAEEYGVLAGIDLSALTDSQLLSLVAREIERRAAERRAAMSEAELERLEAESAVKIRNDPFMQKWGKASRTLIQRKYTDMM